MKKKILAILIASIIVVTALSAMSVNAGTKKKTASEIIKRYIYGNSNSVGGTYQATISGTVYGTNVDKDLDVDFIGLPGIPIHFHTTDNPTGSQVGTSGSGGSYSVGVTFTVPDGWTGTYAITLTAIPDFKSTKYTPGATVVYISSSQLQNNDLNFNYKDIYCIKIPISSVNVVNKVSPVVNRISPFRPFRTIFSFPIFNNW